MSKTTVDRAAEEAREAAQRSRADAEAKRLDQDFVWLMEQKPFRAFAKRLLRAAGQDRDVWSTHAATQSRNASRWDFVNTELLQRIKALCPKLEILMDKENPSDGND